MDSNGIKVGRGEMEEYNCRFLYESGVISLEGRL